MIPGGHATWQNPRVLLTLALVFLCGTLFGVVSARLAIPPAPLKVGPYWREGGRDISLQRFRKELNLTSAQAEELETVLDDFVMYYQMLQSQMDEVRATGKNRIIQVLNPEQRLKFERMLNELQAKQQIR